MFKFVSFNLQYAVVPQYIYPSILVAYLIIKFGMKYKDYIMVSVYIYIYIFVIKVDISGIRVLNTSIR